jgi:hypothetical protein
MGAILLAFSFLSCYFENKLPNSGCFACEPARIFLFTWGSQSHNQRSFQVNARFGANVFYPVAPFIS